MPHPRIRLRWPWVVAPLALLLLAGCPGPDDDGDGTATTEVTEPSTTEPPGPAAAQFTRREINSFTADQVDAYRQGVALMQSRQPDDPTSWIYQANMHGFPTNNAICQVTPGSPQPAWSTCQHGSFFFLAWHRMYLYYFERILRQAVQEATGDPNYPFALPFWDYEDPQNHDLPEPFRSPANASNPLYVQQRTTNCNNGDECVSAEEASDDQAMALVPFCSCPPGESCGGCEAGINSDESFGGGAVEAPIHSGSDPGELELQPHGVVHNAVGGFTGWMSYFTCAARDPIFWLHHANIDRLWQVWLNQGGGRANPLGNDEWKTQTFTFFDENGQAVEMTGCQILNTATQLDYEYDGVPVENVTLCEEAGPPPAAPGAAPPPAAPLAQTPERTTNLGRSPVSVSLSVPPAANERMAAPGGRVRLVVEDLQLLRPGVHYQVYLNLPEGARPDPKGPNFIGHVALFTEPEHSEPVDRSFDVTDEVQELRRRGEWSGEVRVTFVPGHGEDVMAAAPGGAAPFLRFRRIALVER